MLKRQLRRRSFALKLLPALLLPALASCDLSPRLGTPTLPLPPPEIRRDGERYIFSGSVPVAGANVLARNERTQLIFGARTVTQLYTFPVEAEPGDFFTMFYTVGFDQSSPIIVEIPEPATPDAGVP